MSKHKKKINVNSYWRVTKSGKAVPVRRHVRKNYGAIEEQNPFLKEYQKAIAEEDEEKLEELKDKFRAWNRKKLEEYKRENEV